MRKNRHKCSAAVAWLLCLSMKVKNIYEQRQYFWEAVDGEQPYPFHRIMNAYGWKLVVRTPSFLVRK